ncbi:acyltransferase [Nocardia sp. NPDC051570]|uniref:acyltransferase n=1 Tax=Nocardia sp. NPDC051570 TaxID=3364324 RepID=UPI0037B58E15
MPPTATAIDAAPRIIEPAARRADERTGPRRPYLYQLDLFRVLTFACVIGVHVVGRSTDPSNVAANEVMSLLHFTREAFFALTGFVLVYQQANRPLRAGKFWRRRIALVGIPYLAWSVIYWAYSIVTGMHVETARAALWRLVFEIATGGAWYQLYFLLVTMQVYLLFPLIQRLLKATAGHHRWVLAVSAAVQVGCLLWLAHPPTLTGSAAGVWTDLYVTVLPYQFYVLAGAIAAWHIDAIDRVVDRFGPMIVGATVLAGVAAVAVYMDQIGQGVPPWQASEVFQPHLMPFYVLIIGGLYTVGRWWARHRRSDTLMARAVSLGADRSLGVFLLHPLVLQLLAPVVPWLTSAFGTLSGVAVLYVVVLAGTLFGTEILRRIPGSLWLTGRPMLHTRLPRIGYRKAISPVAPTPTYRPLVTQSVPFPR